MEKKLFNSEVLDSWRNIDPDNWKVIVNDIINIYSDSSSKAYDELKAAVALSNWTQVKALAHNLKSSFANVGGEKGHQILHQVEQLISERKNADAAILLSKFDEVYNSTLISLKSYQAVSSGN